MAAHDEKRWKETRAQAFRQGWRRVDAYGFERYEDARRDWYILHGEEDAARYRHHDRSREERCTQALLARILCSNASHVP